MYGRVSMQFIATLHDSVGMLAQATEESKMPMTFEMLNQSYGFMIYETRITELHTDPVLLQVPGIRDRGYVYVDDIPMGILSRSEGISSLPIQIQPGQKLSIIVENQGRVCYGSDLADQKGIIGNVTLGHKILLNWKMTGIPLSDGRRLERYCMKVLASKRTSSELEKILG